MSASTSIRINENLYKQAKQDAAIEHRTISGQIEFWAGLGRAAIDNPDLPISFIAESLASMSEAREEATPFIPRSLDILPALKGYNGDSLLLRSRCVSLLPTGFCC